jgi:ATP-dependent DNA ligase
MPARIDDGRAQLLSRTGLDWTDKYPSVVEALANVKAKAAYIDGELCGVDDAGFAAATSRSSRPILIWPRWQRTLKP